MTVSFKTLKRRWYARKFFNSIERCRDVGLQPDVVVHDNHLELQLLDEDNDVKFNDGYVYGEGTYVNGNIHLKNISNPIRLTMNGVEAVEVDEDIPDHLEAINEESGIKGELLHAPTAKLIIAHNKTATIRQAGETGGIDMELLGYVVGGLGALFVVFLIMQHMGVI